MINIVVFSKDRACQLDALMRSIEDNVVNWDKYKWTVIFKASNESFQRAYDHLRGTRLGRYYRMVKEDGRKSFQQYVKEHISNDHPYTMFLVDDDAFINRWDSQDGVLDSLKDKNVLTVSMRMDANYNYCYTQKHRVVIPPLVEGLDGSMRWEWPGKGGDWGYPMSLDGHIFRTSDLCGWLVNITFTNPNILESALNCLAPKDKKIMVGYREARLLNVPVNKVQTFNSNHSGLQHNFTAQQLNDLYMQGKIIDLDCIYFATGANAPHFEVELKFK